MTDEPRARRAGGAPRRTGLGRAAAGMAAGVTQLYTAIYYKCEAMRAAVEVACALMAVDSVIVDSR